MTFGPTDLQRLLSRTDLHIDFEDFIKITAKEYPVGKIFSYSPILEGYEDANIRLSTTKGKFVLKIFANEKTLDQIQSYVAILIKAKEKDIPLPVLLEGNQGYFSTFFDGQYTIYYFYTHLFIGKNFDIFTPNTTEIAEVTDILANFNRINQPVADTYDSWGSKYIAKEYAENEKEIPLEIQQLILPVVQGMKKLNTSHFSKSVIHGDLQRKHVLMNKQSNYCILDLGCMRYDAKVYDLSIFLAWFCLGEDTWKEKEKILEIVMKRYTVVHKLSNEELKSLPLLIKSSYGAYLLKTAILIKNGDTSDETREWFNKSKKMLELSKQWEWNIT